MESLVIFLTTFIAALLSSMSGGGTSIINVPVFLSLGMSYPLAAATVLVNSSFWVLPASRNYLKGRKIDWRFVIPFSLIGLIGSYLAVQSVIALNKRTLEIVVGVIILLLVTFVYFRKDFGLEEKPVYSRLRQALAYPFALLHGFYETFFGSGNGIAFAIVMRYTKGFDFIESLGTYYLVCFPWVVFSAVLFISRGYYDLSVMPFAVTGSVAGAFIGSRYAKQKGNRFIKLLFVGVGSALGLKLLLGW